ncbi:MAG: dTDP-4-dehydrorhamnose reductase [Candidatus Moranbacteria bacterium RIFOXYA12_FULL_44_15]|nr:MAG: dTDP-4-dehydrorhamnose reductase [Candidatus Moranbacteria bacterium RIFOXYA12_FULL_44_15]OGI34926.1 MAG: dTDP-4-dehydrorhamnose reductase [Candidatus Moranbacteria bacterium RIFOXYA2_FULL_43_15]
MKKILIIGSQGMLGQELVKAFKKDKNYKTIAWDRKDIDITKEKEVMKKIGFTKPDVIINAAAYNAVDKCENDKKEYALAKDVNGLAPGYLAKVAKKNKAVLVHYSTDYVFDGDFEKLISKEPQGCTHSCATCSLHENFQPEIGYREDDKPNPVNNYGKSKLLGEKEVVKNIKNYYLIRISKLFGAPALGESAKKSFFDIMLGLGKDKKEVRVVDEETSCFTYAPDLAKKTKEILDSQKPFGIYHVTNGGSCTWYEAAVELYKQASAKGGSAYGGKIKTKIIPVPGAEFPRPAKRPFYSVLVNTKLNPMRDWKEALKEYLKK